MRVKVDFSSEIIKNWPEIFGEIALNVVPLYYLNSIRIIFKNEKIWEIDLVENVEYPEIVLDEMFNFYQNDIDSIDVKIDVDQIKEDIIRQTTKFLKKQRLT